LAAGLYPFQLGSLSTPPDSLAAIKGPHHGREGKERKNGMGEEEGEGEEERGNGLIPKRTPWIRQ